MSLFQCEILKSGYRPTANNREVYRMKIKDHVPYVFAGTALILALLTLTPLIALSLHTPVPASPEEPVLGSLVRVTDSERVCGEYMGYYHLTHIVKSSAGDLYYVRSSQESRLVGVDICS
ncbi:MAG: hypothetical protein GY774_04850 [Planctomycetes bacterium]|nr:hypothetical protein [Planctomycetota bacterium]